MFEIGPSLREARAKRGLSEEDVQKAIRIRGRYLNALEEERWEQLPGDAYTKGFLRTYAEFLGLNGNLYVDEFNSRHAHRDEGPLVPEALAPTTLGRVGLVRPLLAIGAIVAIVAAVAAWQLHGSGSSTPQPASARGAKPKQATKPATGEPKAATKKRTTPASAAVALPTRGAFAATRGRVWLLVRQGGPTGAVVFQGVLEQGQTLPVKLTQPIWFRVGAPWALDVRVGGKLVHGLPSAPANMLLSGHGLAPATPAG